MLLSFVPSYFPFRYVSETYSNYCRGSLHENWMVPLLFSEIVCFSAKLVERGRVLEL
jgi:hypothetical protein